MNYRVRDWGRYKHFKDRNAPWIKLNKDLLNSRDWFDLTAEAARVLVMLWLVASEDPGREGNLPDQRELAFRLRMEEPEVRKHLDVLGKWLERTDTDADTRNADVLQHDDEMISHEPMKRNSSIPVPKKRETALSTRKKYNQTQYSKEFREFWTLYPKKLGKTKAYSRFTKVAKTIDPMVIIAGLREQLRYSSFTEDPQHFTFPETWLNQRRWEKKAPGVDKESGPA